jgi:hypothetical protein
LAILEIPGIELIAAPDLRRGATRVRERWRVQHALESEATMIERAVYGATLEQAAASRILEQIQLAQGAAALVATLERALLAGFRSMAAELGERARSAIEREPIFAEVGKALERLLTMTLGATDSRTGEELARLLSVACERAAWLLEGIEGAHVAFSRPDVSAIAALGHCVRESDALPPTVRGAILDVFARRTAAPSAPPAIRGACLGAQWSARDAGHPTDAAAAASAILSTPNPSLGDFLSGLFLLARDEFLASSSLLDIVDERIRTLDRDDFLVALPSLRRAFSFFPPHERLTMAKRLVRASTANIEADSLLRTPFSVETVQRGARLESAIFDLAERFSLIGGGA